MEWISVKDRLPEPDQSVLGIHEKMLMSPHKAFYEERHGLFHSLESMSNIPCNFTHWMPLPKPPDEKHELD